MTNRRYTTSELLKLATIRAKGYGNFLDDIHTTEKAVFMKSIDTFVVWLNKMESESKIDYLLTL